MKRLIQTAVVASLAVLACATGVHAQECPQERREWILCGEGDVCWQQYMKHHCPYNWPPAVWTCGCYQPINCCGENYDSWFGTPCGEYCAGCEKSKKDQQRHADTRHKNAARRASLGPKPLPGASTSAHDKTAPNTRVVEVRP